MKNRFRIEIYDEVKSNDLTIYSEQGVDKDHLVELVYSNMANFDGNVRAFVFDKLNWQLLNTPFHSFLKCIKINKWNIFFFCSFVYVHIPLYHTYN